VVAILPLFDSSEFDISRSGNCESECKKVEAIKMSLYISSFLYIELVQFCNGTMLYLSFY